MLRLYRSSDLNLLADKLQDELSHNLPENPLQSELVVVQNYGMERWLKMQLAQRHGIAANLEIDFPAELIWKLFRILDPSITENLSSDKDPMHFAILDIILSSSKEDSLAPLYRYVKAESASMRATRAWKLSERIAGLFDRYQIYRPEMLLQWQQGMLQTERETERWQGSLWNRLQERWKSHSKDGITKHRAELHQNLLNAIKNNSFKAEQLPQRISIFGVSPLPPIFLEAFIQLSKVVDVSFYWLDLIQSKNNNHPLVKSWGNQGKIFLQLFYQSVEKKDAIKNEFREKKLKKAGGRSTNMLGKLQESILTDDVSKIEQDFTYDHSIQFHSCHSPMREVEVLYHQLLALFDENPDLNPDDVVITCTDMELYSPLIEAVFGRVEDNLPYIPFSIADRGWASSSSAAQTFLNILELSQSRFKVTDVVKLLQMPVIHENLNAGFEDINKLEKWIKENNIRWGIDEHFKRQLGLPEENSFTWQAGLSRMMLGYAMHRNEKGLYNGYLPYKGIEGTESAELLGDAFELLNYLFYLQSELSQLKTISNWTKVLDDIIDTLLPNTQEYADEIINLRSCLEELNENSAIGSFDRKISFKIVQTYLQQKLDKQKNTGRFGRGVTFSSMVGIRGIPFEAIGILGMDEESFPQIDTTVAFDLMQSNPIPGDPDKTEDERYLFLTTILSAKRSLYISYTGQSNQQNVRSAPSVFVRELLNVLEEQFDISKDNLIIEHRLQPFSPHYFRSDKAGLFSFSSLHLNTAKQLQSTERKDADTPNILFNKLETTEGGTEAVELKSLISFYKHPSKFVLQNLMGIYMPNENVSEDNRELFKLNGLERYRINNELLDELIAKNPLDPMKAVFKARDLLPVHLEGERVFKQRVKEVKHFFGSFESEISNRDGPLGIDLLLSGKSNPFHLKGELDEIYGDHLLLTRFGDIRAKDAVEWWIKHLVWCAMQENNEPTTSHYYGYDRKKGKVLHSTLAPVNDAKDILMEIVEKYEHGLRHPFPFFPKTSHAFANEINEEETNINSALYKANKEWKGSKFKFTTESEDPYNNIIFKNFKLLPDSSFIELSKYFFKPYLSSLKDK